MRHSHHDTDRDPKAGVTISSFARDYAADAKVAEHTHGSDQVIFGTRGVMEVAASRRFWLIAPHFAVWIPARTRHRIRMSGAVSMRTLYLRRELGTNLPVTGTVFYVTPLLRELTVEAVRIGSLLESDPLHQALRALIVMQVQKASPVPTSVTLPSDPRALAVATQFIAAPAARASLREMCAAAGATVRTIERVFKKEVGTSFEVWRRQARLMKAIELLVGGSSVKEAALKVGYQQPGPFIEMFRRALGATPRTWTSSLIRNA